MSPASLVENRLAALVNDFLRIKNAPEDWHVFVGYIKIDILKELEENTVAHRNMMSECGFLLMINKVTGIH